ncbi:MAG: hypothetical protein PHE61_07725 [Candidatus Omnitrophica bacterium]|nr:hypothetical protein [Candidatus Omnitrophota bacterium]
MRKTLLLAVLSVAFIVSQAFAYEIKVEETSSHEIKNGKKVSKVMLEKWVYEVNEGESTIAEKKLREPGEAEPMAKVPDSIYKIVDKSDGVLTAVRVWNAGEALVNFGKDGLFCRFQDLRLDIDAKGVSETFANVSYGRYTVSLKDVK